MGAPVVLTGGMSGQGDLIVQGRVRTEASLRVHNITIGESGWVMGDIYGSNIYVEGEVRGDLFGEEQVIIRRSGKVWGNVTAPRVNLEQGAQFEGHIDMVEEPAINSPRPRYKP